MTTYLNTEIIIRLEPLTCGVVGCGIPFAISRSLYNEAQADHSIGFWCPNGHKVYFQGRSTLDRLRDAQTAQVALRDQIEAACRDAEQARVALLRDRQRFANGVCPCCNRSFGNVRRHMADQHPDYDTTRVVQRSTVRFRCSCGRSFESLQGLRVHQGSQRGDNWFEPSAPGWRAHLTRV